MRPDPAPSPARRRMARDDRARQLLDVAEEVFRERGVHAASMEDIAERAGVTKPVVYDHFGSKDGLLAAVIRRSGAQLQEATAAAVAGAAGPEDALARGLTAYFRFIEGERASWLALLTETAAPSSAAATALEAVRREQADYLATLIAAELPDREPARALVYAQVVVGAGERLAMFNAGERALAPDDLAAQLMDVIWVGFAALRDGRRWSARVRPGRSPLRPA